MAFACSMVFGEAYKGEAYCKKADEKLNAKMRGC